MLKRKIELFLSEWKRTSNHKPLIIKGARQIGKTMSVRKFARENYGSVIEINFALQPRYRQIFADGYEAEDIVRNISLLDPDAEFRENDTLIFFDELQAFPDCATCLKSFCQCGKYDVICSGSLMGIYYQQIESNSVGYKEDFNMYPMDFEEFLWAKGYGDDFTGSILEKMLNVKPLSVVEYDVLLSLFKDYLIVGGMPEVVNRYAETGNFSGSLKNQRQLLLDYEEDITKYAGGLDKGRILDIYRNIPVFLAKENKKFQISKIAHNARTREYSGTVEWLDNAGIVNVCHCLQIPELPLKGNYDPKNFKLYFADTGLLVASLDDEAQEDLRANKNFGACKGAIYENIVGDMLAKQGYSLYFYKNEKSTVEMDFFIRDAHSLIPVEVKATDGPTRSLVRLTDSDAYPDIKYGIKLCNKNIGFNGKFYTFPYFTAFLLRRWCHAGVYDRQI